MRADQDRTARRAMPDRIVVRGGGEIIGFARRAGGSFGHGRLHVVLRRSSGNKVAPNKKGKAKCPAFLVAVPTMSSAGRGRISRRSCQTNRGSSHCPGPPTPARPTESRET